MTTTIQSVSSTELDRCPRPVVAVDLVIVAMQSGALSVLLHRRTEPPFEGTWALPSGVLDVANRSWQGESIAEAARRIFEDQTGIASASCHFASLGAFGRVGRDPRTRVISMGWLVGVSPEQAARVDTDLTCWSAITHEVPWLRLAFDHAEIIATAEATIGTTDATGLALSLVSQPFTVADLRGAYEAILGRPQDARNFRRKFHRLVDTGTVVTSGDKRHQGKSRPANVWRSAPHQTNP